MTKLTLKAPILIMLTLFIQTFSIAQDSTKCIPIPEYIHIMKFAEAGLVCDTIIAEKNLQLEQSFQLINKQKKTIEKV